MMFRPMVAHEPRQERHRQCFDSRLGLLRFEHKMRQTPVSEARRERRRNPRWVDGNRASPPLKKLAAQSMRGVLHLVTHYSVRPRVDPGMMGADSAHQIVVAIAPPRKSLLQRFCIVPQFAVQNDDSHSSPHGGKRNVRGGSGVDLRTSQQPPLPPIEIGLARHE